jgi:NAD(P)-dependent dehydrogenase (short-subunit alcohol dehydrogenase family)
LLDLSRKDTFSKAVYEISILFGGIDILINNAGVNVGPNERKPIHEFDDKMWDWIIGIDLDGVFHFSKAVIPQIISREGGVIINISSVVGQIPFRNQCAFTAAKAGVINLSKAMALELAPHNIRVNVIAPGSIMAEGTKKLFYDDPVKTDAILSHIPQHRVGSPDDIAYAALYLASTEAGYVTGSVLTVDGGWTCGYARDF